MIWFDACKSANEPCFHYINILLPQTPIDLLFGCLCLRRLFQELQQFLRQLRRYLQISFAGSCGWQLRCRSWSLTWSSGSTCRSLWSKCFSILFVFNHFQHWNFSLYTYFKRFENQSPGKNSSVAWMNSDHQRIKRKQSKDDIQQTHRLWVCCVSATKGTAFVSCRLWSIPDARAPQALST